MARKPVTPVDKAWLRMEDPTNLMMITGVMVFGTPMAHDRLKATIERRLLRFDRFRQHVVQSRLFPGKFYWEDDAHFDIDQHLHRVTLSPPGDRQMLQDLVGELMSTPLKFLLGGKDIEESFFIESGYEFSEGSGNTQIVKLTPKNETLYKFLILEIDEKSSDLRRLTIRELSGRILDYVFTDLKMNVKVSDKKFRFEIPDDVEVHYQESSE